VFDNRAGELAEWNAEAIAELAGAAKLDGLFDQTEIEDILKALPKPEFPAAAPDPSTEGGSPAPDPITGEAPEPVLPNAGIRLVQLYLSADQFTEFTAQATELASRYETENITDTVMRAMAYAFNHDS